MDTITAEGYGVVATLTPTELRARGKNKMTHIALLGEEHEAEELVLSLDQISRVEHSRPKFGGFSNGNVVVHTVDGKKYQMHYRAKKQADFADFADRLVAAVGS